jgi:hypothetical protein
MDVAPPPTGSRLEEHGDRLIVRFRPRRSWGELAFLAFWLTFWTFGGIVVFAQLPDEGWGGRAFLVLWLCGWVFGEAFAAYEIAWQLRGRELLVVTPQQLEVRKQIGRFVRTKVYEAELVQDIVARRAPSDEDEEPRTDFALAVTYKHETIPVGEGMGEREAEYVASVVLQRIRPRSWWGEDEPSTAVWDAPAEAPAQRRSWIGSVAFPIVVIAVIVGLAVSTLRHGNSAEEPPAAVRQPNVQRADPLPWKGDYSSPRDYASAMTRWALAGARTTSFGQPTCDSRSTWSRWTCTVRGRASLGPFAGRTMSYRCSSSELGGVVCGPAHPPPLGDARRP